MRFVSATDPNSETALLALQERLRCFYNNAASADEYFAIATESNEAWDTRGPHGLLLALAQPGTSVLDMGCGSAVAWRHLQNRGVSYTGADWSATQIARNQQQHGADAKFVCASLYETGLPSAAFDLVFSCYVIEHLLWPHRMLDEMARLTKPGGLAVVICPHYRKAGRAPSLPHGGALSFRAKLAQHRWWGAARHLACVAWWPLALAARREPFLINLQPTCLTEPYRPDNDAVYFPDRAECAQRLRAAGLADETDELCRQHQIRVPGDICLIAARRTK